LIDKYPPLVAKLARGRYAQLLAGESFVEQQEIASAFSGKVRVEGGTDRLSQLEAEVIQLRAGLDDLSAQFALFKQQFD